MKDPETMANEALWRWLYVLVAPTFMIFAVLACAGTPLAGLPIYTCPTSVPPTAMPTVLPGTATPIPLPTLPPPTPYVIMPPLDFYVGDAVFVGETTAPDRVRFRLQNIMSYPASPDADGLVRRVYAWQLEVRNLGNQAYEIFPALQMYLSEITTGAGNQLGAWGSTQAAADEAGVSIDNDAYSLTPNETRTFRFAAFAPSGSASRFTFTLDPTITSGSGTINWTNQHNPYCLGDIAN